MEKNRKFPFEDPTESNLPAEAFAVHVRNVLSPEAIRVCAVADYDGKVEAIGRKLLALVHSGALETDEDPLEVQVGDSVVVRSRLDQEVQYPSWYCRGVVCAFVQCNATFHVLLTDHGSCVELYRQDFLRLPAALLPEEPLSFTVGIHGLLPATVASDSSLTRTGDTLIVEDWTAAATQFTRDLFAASDGVFFHPRATEDESRVHGDFYVSLGSRVLLLSEALVLRRHAVRLADVLRLLEDPARLREGPEGVVRLDAGAGAAEPSDGARKQRGGPEKLQEARRGRRRRRVLTYGDEDCQKLNCVEDARFPTAVHQAWKELVRSSRPKKLQAHMWPAMRKGSDVVVVGTKGAGKTFGLAVGVAGLLAACEDLPAGNRPSALVLCASSNEVLRFHALCRELLQATRHVKSVAVLSGKSDRTLVAQIFNGCQILVSTPKFLERFLQRNRKLLDFSQLRHLLLDDADTTLEKYGDSVRSLAKAQRLLRGGETQSTLAASRWTPHLKKFLGESVEEPYVCFGSFLEAAVYRAVRTKLHVVSSKRKLDTLRDVLGKEYESTRTMVVCRTSEEAEEVENFLSSDFKLLVARGRMNLFDLKGVRQIWYASTVGQYPLLVCADDLLYDLDVSNVERLVHYSVSLRLRTQFSLRFSVLSDGLLQESCDCTVAIMADEGNDFQIHSIVALVQRLGAVVPEEILLTVQRIADSLDRNKKDHQICDRVRAFGSCLDRSSCALRHCFLPSVDSPITNVSAGDRAKLRVICVHDASHFSARILSYAPAGEADEVQLSSEAYIQVSLKVQKFYASAENRRRCESVEVGTVCALEDTLDNFKRVQVVRVTQEEPKGKHVSRIVDVRSLDSGEILTSVSAYRLLWIPRELAELQRQVVDVFLVGVSPQDEEDSWNQCATDCVHQWFQDNVDERSYVVATVRLHVADTLWVDTLEVGTKLLGYKDLIGSSLKQELLDKEHAVPNDAHLDRLRALCRDAGLDAARN